MTTTLVSTGLRRPAPYMVSVTGIMPGFFRNVSTTMLTQASGTVSGSVQIRPRMKLEELLSNRNVVGLHGVKPVDAWVSSTFTPVRKIELDDVMYDDLAQSPIEDRTTWRRVKPRSIRRSGLPPIVADSADEESWS